MRKFAIVSIVSILAISVFALWRSLVVVDETQAVLLTHFGRPVAVYNARGGDAGPRFKWPWQESIAIDRRLQLSEAASREFLTGDKRNLECGVSIFWRVADPLRYLRAAGAMEVAEARLQERVTSALGATLGRHTFGSLATTDLEEWSLARVCEETEGLCREEALEELGVDIVKVGLRHFGHPLEVRPAIFDLIREERQQVARTVRAEAEAESRVLLSEAESKQTKILAEAEAEASRTRSEGEAESARILNEAHAEDPEFYVFLETLETYRALFDDQATLVLSASSPILRLLKDGPQPATSKPVASEGEKTLGAFSPSGRDGSSK